MVSRNDRLTAWAPVWIWLGVLALESSNIGSSEHTIKILRWLWLQLMGNSNLDALGFINHVLRKTGHFTGYALLSLFLFRALRASWRYRQEIVSQTREYYWQIRWSVQAIAGTLLVATLDELHQSFNPARTGRWQDVVLDCSGAFLIQLLLYRFTRPQDSDPGVREAQAKA